MHRCASLAAVAAIIVAAPASAQVQRAFPQTALRGEIAFGTPPEVALNGEPARLAPGARIRGSSNMIAMSGTLVGTRWVVNYTVDTSGLVKDVWILTAEEAAKRPWPTTPQQAQAWVFDPNAQTWIRP
jgi:hypothetical protein